jgi:hypothetical protein
MTAHPAPDWAAVRRRYEETQDSITIICADAGIAKSRFETVRKREQWRRRNPKPFPPLRKTAAPTQIERDDEIEELPPPDPSAPALAIAPRLLATPVARRRLLERLVAAISMKLEQLERRMTNDLAAGEDSTATDHEREARAIGALIDNLDKITEIETGLGKPAGKSGSTVPATDLADEAERCRRELAERLHRIVEAAEKGA